MTSVEFLKLCARRWYVLALGIVLSLGVAFLASGPTTVYSARTTVNVLEPDGGKTRIVGFHSPDTISMANILAAKVNNGVHTPLASDPDVSLQSIGILQGTYAQVRNVGGQWLSSVTEPVVDVQSVAPTPELALSQLDAEVAKIRSEATKLQDQLKVPADERFQLTLNPTTPLTGSDTTQRSRSLMGYFLFGLGLTLCATWWFDRIALARAGRRDGAGHGSRRTDAVA